MSDIRQDVNMQQMPKPEEGSPVPGLTIHLDDGSPPRLLVHGELDIATAGELGAALEGALTTDPSVVVDMTGVTFVDASGLRVILDAAASRDGDGPLTLVNARRVARLLDLLGLSGIRYLELRDEGGTERAG